jgi:hypothetical protein
MHEVFTGMPESSKFLWVFLLKRDCVDPVNVQGLPQNSITGCLPVRVSWSMMNAAIANQFPVMHRIGSEIGFDRSKL